MTDEECVKKRGIIREVQRVASDRSGIRSMCIDKVGSAVQASGRITRRARDGRGRMR